MIASVTDLPLEEQPISEQYRVAADEWADAENAAHLLEELKTTTLEQKKCELIDRDPKMSEAKAERLVKASEDWELYLYDMCQARAAATFLKQKLRVIEMKHREWIDGNASARQEMRLTDLHP